MNFPKVSSARLKSIRSLSRKSARSESGLFLVEGPKLVADAIETGWQAVVILVSAGGLDHPPMNALLRIAEGKGVEVMQCSTKDMAYASATEQSQGILAVVRQKAWKPEDILSRDARLILALDGIQDPGNAGTCIRSADWFGAGGVLLGEGSASVYNEKTVRASAGSIFHLPVVEQADLASVLQDLNRKGYHIIGANGSARRAYTDLDDHAKVVLVLGSEAAGFSESVERAIQTSVAIPRYGNGESLNVSIAGSIILAHLSRLHGKGGR